MGRNTNKKGKQKETTSVVPASSQAPPPPPPPPPPPASVPTIQAPSPPTAKHIRHPPTTMAVIEEEDAQAGPSGDSYEGTEGWQDLGQQEDMTDARWVVGSIMEPGNGNEDWGVANDSHWETNSVAAPPPPPPPPQPQQKNPGGSRAQAKHQQQQFAHPHQQRHEQQHKQHANASSMGQTAWNHPEGVNKATWNTANNNHNMKGDWTAWGAENSLEVQSAAPDSMEDWGGDNGNDLNNWSQTDPTWGHSASVPSARTHTTSRQQQSGWQNWSAEAQRLPKSHQPYPVPQNQGGTYPQAANGGWQQAPQRWPPPNMQKNPHQQPLNHDTQHEYYDGNGKKNKKNKQQSKKQKKQQHQETNDVWGLGGGWSDLGVGAEDDSVRDDWGRQVHFPPPNNGVNPAPPAPPAVVDPFSVYTSPTNSLGITLHPSDTPMSKTLAYAYHGTGASPGGDTDVHFNESHGKAIQGVWNAFYNQSRKADDRFHWLFPPGKNERVAALMAWIDTMSPVIASYGLQKFLQTRQRGALFVNAEYSPLQVPKQPTLDWMAWEQIQPTMDRVLQESVGVAIWRRKLAIPHNVRLAYEAQITQITSALPTTYLVHVDELPRKPDPTPPPPPPKKKRKWYKLWLSS
ncbi:hypothetical protein F5141DRAFT_1124048 [Pisolithus sp. B1]|nr:hypothetical protein F5141DRAFT_1124048 [Pisolithus sp. B1]